jgi:hypothetical protein
MPVAHSSSAGPVQRWWPPALAIATAVLDLVARQVLSGSSLG